MHFIRCEVCDGPATRCCAGLDQPMEHYCETHYWEHVQEAHKGKELPGSSHMKKARRK